MLVLSSVPSSRKNRAVRRGWSTEKHGAASACADVVNGSKCKSAPCARSGGRGGDPWKRENTRSVGCYGHRVLEMGGQRAVLGRDRPAVVMEVHVRASGGDHRLDRDRHPLVQGPAAAGLAEVRDLRLLVVR